MIVAQAFWTNLAALAQNRAQRLSLGVEARGAQKETPPVEGGAEVRRLKAPEPGESVRAFTNHQGPITLRNH
jgi:hypothetical protein